MTDEENKNLEAYVSPSGEYLIPVEWSVYSTIKVRGKDIHNLKDALDAAEKVIDDIPTSTEHEYIDGSYKLSVDCDEDAINTQMYRTVSGIVLDVNDGETKISS